MKDFICDRSVLWKDPQFGTCEIMKSWHGKLGGQIAQKNGKAVVPLCSNLGGIIANDPILVLCCLGVKLFLIEDVNDPVLVLPIYCWGAE